MRIHGRATGLLFFVFPLAYFLSYFLVRLYVNGDQVHYRAFYEAISTVSYREAFVLARGYIDAGEPLTVFLLWLGSCLGIPKDHYISFFNAVLLTQVIFLLKRYRAGPVVTLLMVTNFYVLVLMTGAERLKFAYIILASAALFRGYAKSVWVIAPLAHFQAFLFAPSILLARFYGEIKDLFSKGVVSKKNLFAFLAVLFFLIILSVNLYPSLAKKGGSYFDSERSVLELLSLVCLTFVSVFSSRNWRRMLVLLMPCYPIVFMLGGERGNMIAITIALSILMVERRLNNPAVLIMLTYFSWKSISFVKNIILYGNGFAFA